RNKRTSPFRVVYTKGLGLSHKGIAGIVFLFDRVFFSSTPVWLHFVIAEIEDAFQTGRNFLIIWWNS
ncbi:MAG TPA: hypothetical protein PKA63_07710, partial [Oligoflexia bacterium]|nr:hypothetical protein [Oligoflexia bacterium]